MDYNIHAERAKFLFSNNKNQQEESSNDQNNFKDSPRSGVSTISASTDNGTIDSTWLGLTIAKEIVRAFGGSEEDKVRLEEEQEEEKEGDIYYQDPRPLEQVQLKRIPRQLGNGEQQCDEMTTLPWLLTITHS